MEPCCSKESVFKEYTQYIFKKIAENNKNNSLWPKEFEQCHSDYERVLCLFNLLKPDANATSIFGLPTSNPISDAWSRKNDEMAISTREVGNTRWKEKKRNQALDLYTVSLFFAKSPLQQALALGNRSAVLYSFACYTEAAEDINLAIELGFPKEKRSRLHIRLGQCLLYLHNCELATHNFRQATSLLAEYPNERLLELANSGLEEGRAGCGRDYELAWRCQHNIVEPLKWVKNDSKSEVSETSPKLLAAGSNSSVCLRNSGLDKGWMLQTTRDVQPGETLIVDSPYVSRLMKLHFRTNCYHCYRRSLNLKPCHGCTLIGFCGDTCREKAMQLPSKEASSPRLGLGCHGYECGSLSCLLMDNYAGWPLHPTEPNELPLGDEQITQLAFACVADTHPDLLLDNLCGVNMDKTSFSGSRPFVEQTVPRTPPSVIDPHKYSSIEWLVANSEHRSFSDLWQRTVASVFLTYCLHVGGYPMCWKEQAEILPSPFNRPEIAPAGWIASCILNHLQTASINAHIHSEALNNSSNPPGRLSLNKIIVSSIASCLYPTLSLINHSCDPNVNRHSCGAGRCVLTSLRYLPVGSELLDGYVMPYFIQNKKKRQEKLYRQYHFKCAYAAREYGWQSPGPTIYKCPSHGPVASCRCSELSSNCLKFQWYTAKQWNVIDKIKALPLSTLDAHVVSAELQECWNLLRKCSEYFVHPGHLQNWLEELCKKMLFVQSGNWSVLPIEI